MEKKKKTILIIFILIIASIPIPIILILFPPNETVGERKAFIVCSANDFYRKDDEPGFNKGNDGKFNDDEINWERDPPSDGNIFQSLTPIPGPDGNNGILIFQSLINGVVNVDITYNWTKFYSIIKYAEYNMSAWVHFSSALGPPGVRLGLRWLNSTNDIVRTDWSSYRFDPLGIWILMNTTGIAYQSPTNEITQLILVLSIEGLMNAGDQIYFDDVNIEKTAPPPISSSPPTSIDSDGFPAQALQVYWTLKYHGYIDDNIFFMLYHTGDSTIDINALDGISNDLTNAIVDVENDNVNATRFKQELNISNSGSFASKLNSKDQLIIYMVDHGSNSILPDNNATFHFEADGSYISELEFYTLVKEISVKRMIINADFCYSGNFLNENQNIGNSWYDITNSILISSSSDNLSWYWRDNTNVDGFAGSWFFHQFWYKLNQSASIEEAFNYAMNYIPSGLTQPIGILQSPLIYDNMGINNTWSFNGPIYL
ncbi:MAG: hypothetical protein JXA99_08250 [Candidatus Lokiarchaeota archaeon]|nr:hypothetical protein [Candidatus Lokiarchaeota archaeon]